MRFEYDSAKREFNRAKHGLALSLASELSCDEALVWVDPRFEYNELRMVGLVPHGDRLHYVAFVDRGRIRRVISLRFAERREVKHNVEQCP